MPDEVQIIRQTPPSKALSRILRLLVHTLDVQAAVISQGPQNAQEVVAVTGMVFDEFPIRSSLMAEAWGQANLVIIPDTQTDLRFSDDPFVTPPTSMGFFAGMTLYDAQGTPLGLLTVMSGYPRPLDENEVRQIGEFAALCARELAAPDLLETKLAAAQARISELEMLLAQETAQLTQTQTDLQEAKDAAEAANRTRTMFLANVSHELRTPLNAILGFAQVLQRDQELPPKHHDTVSVISRSGTYLLELINDVLEMSKIEAGQAVLHNHSFDLDSLLQELGSLFMLRNSTDDLQLVFDNAPNVPRYLYGDSAKLRQVLINLLSNAFKFTEEGLITVRVRYAPSPAPSTEEKPINEIWFEVEDTGVGISPEDQGLIFQPFVQSKTQPHAERGTGLGLPISKHFVSMMGGQLTVSSMPDQGSTFQFNVQMKKAKTADLLPQENQPQVIGVEPGQKQFRLLIIEDIHTTRNLLIQLLEPFGFLIKEAENGVEGLKVWENWKPDLIWMDLVMPEMDGYETTRQIKATEEGKNIPIIALTANAFEEQRREALAAGCDDFIRKPFLDTEIFQVLEKHLGVRYIYRQDSPTSVFTGPLMTRTLSSDMLVNLPMDWLSQLEEATIRSDFDQIIKNIEQIRESRPKVADAIAGWAHEFEYGKILRFIHKARMK
jgi:signal transduction histidine kinase/ActR/RegA family two-component response regulator